MHAFKWSSAGPRKIYVITIDYVLSDFIISIVDL